MRRSGCHLFSEDKPGLYNVFWGFKMHFFDVFSRTWIFMFKYREKKKFSSVVLFICLTSRHFAKDFQKQLHFGLQSQWQLAGQSKYFSEKPGGIAGRLKKSVMAIADCV